MNLVSSAASRRMMSPSKATRKPYGIVVLCSITLSYPYASQQGLGFRTRSLARVTLYLSAKTSAGGWFDAAVLSDSDHPVAAPYQKHYNSSNALDRNGGQMGHSRE